MKNRQSRKPYVVCHMIATLDGRIRTHAWPDQGTAYAEYERTADTYDADAWMCGRITMEPHAGRVRPVREVERTARRPGGRRADFVAPHARRPYAVAVDPKGRLTWRTNDIHGSHVVAVLSARVADDHLAFLRARGVSYLFAGADDIDLSLVLDKLAGAFGVKRLLLEGGGNINGAMLRQGLIDEVSLLLAPLADGSPGTPTLFDVADGIAQRRVTKMRLVAMEKRRGDILWLRYKARPARKKDAPAPR